MIYVRLTSAVLLAVIAAPSSAQSREVGCLLASSTVAPQLTDPKARQLAEAVTYFYLGRLATSITPEQLKLSFAEQRKALQGKNANAVMNACLGPVRERAKIAQSAAQAAPK
jgi:hypothetical protein